MQPANSRGGRVGLAFVSMWTVVTASCPLCICLTAEASLVPLHCCPEPIIALGSHSPSPWTHFIDVLFDLEINVDDKLLTLWLPSRGSAGCAVEGPWLLPLLFSRWPNLLFHFWLPRDSKTCSCY